MAAQVTRTPATATAAMVLKGALCRVLAIPNARTTIGTRFSEGNKVGRGTNEREENCMMYERWLCLRLQYVEKGKRWI